MLAICVNTVSQKIYHLLIYTHSPFMVTIIQKPMGIGYAAKMSHIKYSGI